MQKYRLILLCVAVSALVAFALVGWPARHPPLLEVSFTGYTNVAGTRLATFSFTNTCGMTVRWSVSYEIQVLGQAGFGLGARLLWPEKRLKPGDSWTFSIPVPNGNGPWRAMFYFSADSFRRKLSDRLSGLRFVPQSWLRPPPDEWTRTGWIDR